MPNDLPDWSSAVNVQAGSISITGTPTVIVSGTVAISITGANTVVLGGGAASIGSISAIGSTVTVAGTINIGNTPAVTVSGTVSVSIVAGSVSITGAPNINILSQSVNLLTGTGQVAVGTPASGVGGAAVTTTLALPVGIQALALDFNHGSPAAFSHIKITGHQTQLIYYESYNFASVSLDSIVAVAPVLYARDTSIDVLVDSTAGGAPYILAITGLQNSVPEFLDYYRPPWAFPNQLPLSFNVALGIGGAINIVGPVANVRVWLHRLHIEMAVPAGAAAPNINYAQSNGTLLGFVGGLVAAGPIVADVDFEGAPLPLGQGFQIGNSTGVANPRMFGTLTYSLS